MKRKAIYKIVVSPRNMAVSYFTGGGFKNTVNIPITLEEESMFDEVVKTVNIAENRKAMYKELSAETGEPTDLTLKIMDMKDRFPDMLRIADQFMRSDDDRFHRLYRDETEDSNNNQ